MPAAPRRRRAATTATEAVTKAKEAGKPVESTTGAHGEELLQRPFSLDEPEKPTAKPAGGRVRVYHKRKTKMWLSDGSCIGPHEEREIPAADADNPLVAQHVVVMK